jgi:phage-related protein
MGDGLHELRLKRPDGIARVFYCVLADRRIVMLHVFVKKSVKTPSKELVTARERLRKLRQ